jgi:hypothetical protein
MLRIAPTADLVCYACEIDDMAEGRLRAVRDCRPSGSSKGFAAAPHVGFEPKLHDAALCSNGSIWGRFGHPAEARYAYS